MAGRRPKPTALKELHGNPGKRALNEEEPKPILGIPDRPKGLTGESRAEWDRIAPQLAAMGVLSRIDGSALAGYCRCYARWMEAEEMLAKTSLIVKTPKGYPIQNPCISIANTALEQMRKFLIEFGMTPSSRTRIKAGNVEKEDPLRAFLERKKKSAEARVN